jgi:hypothetical protein
MTNPLAIPIPEAARLGGIRSSTIYAKISRDNLKVRKVGRLKIFKYAFAIYLLSGIEASSPTNLTDKVDFKLLASVKKYELGNFIRQSEIGLGFELGLGGCVTTHQNKMAEEEGFEPSVGY